MIAHLRGRVVEVALGHVVLDVGGVGYLVYCPPGAVKVRPGEEATLFTHLAVREDAMTLYGFADLPGRALFTTLLGVSGVGPKVALATIGTLGADGLRRAVIAEDVTAITSVPGVGRKGAQRMILELRERLGGDGAELPGAAGSAVQADPGTEAAEALSGLGYQPAEVRAALDVARRDAADGDAETLLRAALRALGGASTGDRS